MSFNLGDGYIFSESKTNMYTCTVLNLETHFHAVSASPTTNID